MRNAFESLVSLSTSEARALKYDRRTTSRNRGAIPLPEDKTQRIKLFAALAVIALASVWLMYYVASSISVGGVTKASESPAWVAAHALTDKLIADYRFADTSLTVVTEKPLAFKVVGGIKSAKDLEALKKYMGEIRPEGDFEIDVELISP